MPPWDQVLPILNGIVGGVALAGVIWLLVTGKFHLARETESEKSKTAIYEKLYLDEKVDRIRAQDKMDEMADDLVKQSESHSQTIAMIREMMAVLRVKEET
jgi:hypothetical protein